MPTTAGGEYISFVWQQLSQVQATLARLEQAVQQQTAHIDKLEARAEEAKESIHGIKIRLAVWGTIASALATAALAVASIGGFVVKEVWDLSKPAILQKLANDPVAQPPNPAPVPPRQSGSKS